MFNSNGEAPGNPIINIDFYDREGGDRPEFPFPGVWLYVDNLTGLQLVGVDLDDSSSLREYLGEKISAEALNGSGAFNHIELRVKDSDALNSGLNAGGYTYRERNIASMNLFQVFVEKLDGITIELNNREQIKSSHNCRYRI